MGSFTIKMLILALVNARAKHAERRTLPAARSNDLNALRPKWQSCIGIRGHFENSRDQVRVDQD